MLWLRKLRQLSYILIVALNVLACCGCNQKLGPPPKPPNVPEAAIWAGGPDGGSWFLCSEIDQGTKYYCKIYDDYTGEILADGPFEAEEGVRIVSFEPSFFDGDVIVLRGYDKLSPAPAQDSN